MFYLSIFLANIKNAAKSKKKSLLTVKTNLILEIAELLFELGYIRGFTIINKKRIKIFLKYHKNICTIRYLNLINKPSQKIYIKKKNLIGRNFLTYNVTNSFKILSTSNPSTPILTDIECLMLNLGGKPLLLIG